MCHRKGSKKEGAIVRGQGAFYTGEFEVDGMLSTLFFNAWEKPRNSIKRWIGRETILFISSWAYRWRRGDVNLHRG